MKTLIFSLLIAASTQAFAANKGISGAQISDQIAEALQGRSQATGQLIDGRQCSVSLQVGSGRSESFDTVTVNYGSHTLPITIARSGSYGLRTEESREGYVTEIFSIAFGDARQELRLTKVLPTVFIVRAKMSFRGQAADSADCFVSL